MTLRVMTYNILDGGEKREHYLSSVLASVQPDIVVFQEVYHSKTLESFADLLNASFYLGEANSSRHVGIISKLPIVTCRNHRPLPLIWRNIVEAEIECDSSTHIWVLGVHPMAFLWIGFEFWRLAEARFSIGLANRHAGPCLIAGDFNAIAPGDSPRTDAMPKGLRAAIRSQGNRIYRFAMQAYFSAGFRDCYRYINPGDDGFTLPPPNPNSRLDYILANSALAPRLRKCWVVREPEAVLKASDHYPVVAEFDL